jgi:hypothetical protein
MPVDSHAKASGDYNIRSLYFDDYNNRCFYENENNSHAKFRIRIYNQSSEKISLELKQKYRDKVLKTACPLTMNQATQLMNGRYPADISEQPQLLQRLSFEMMSHLMKPVIIVEYERIPYIYKNGNVRVTFDTVISSSNTISRFFEKIIPKRPVLPAGMHLLEVKFDEYLPDLIYRGLQLENLQQTAFSKYYLSRKYTL